MSNRCIRFRYTIRKKELKRKPQNCVKNFLTFPRTHPLKEMRGQHLKTPPNIFTRSLQGDQEWHKKCITVSSRVLRDSTPRFVCPLVRRSVRPTVRPSVTLNFFCFLRSLASLLLPKWSSDLKYGPCPAARDWGSRVSGLFLVACSSCRSKLPLNLSRFML